MSRRQGPLRKPGKGDTDKPRPRSQSRTGRRHPLRAGRGPTGRSFLVCSRCLGRGSRCTFVALLPGPATGDLEFERPTEERADQHNAREHSGALEGGRHRDRSDDVGGDQELEPQEDDLPRNRRYFPYTSPCRRASRIRANTVVRTAPATTTITRPHLPLDPRPRSNPENPCACSSPVRATPPRPVALL
jgi:hypothetical protein